MKILVIEILVKNDIPPYSSVLSFIIKRRSIETAFKNPRFLCNNLFKRSIKKRLIKTLANTDYMVLNVHTNTGRCLLTLTVKTFASEVY